MASKHDADAERLAADCKARDARLEARRSRDPTAISSDGPPSHRMGDENSSRALSVPPRDEPDPNKEEARLPPHPPRVPLPPESLTLHPSRLLRTPLHPYREGRGVLDTESVSQYFSHKVECRIFVSACADSDILDESLAPSLQKFHPVYDPLRDDDPFLSFGAVDGLLPGKTAEETMVLHDLVMHWVQPHINLNWETLEEGIRKFGEEKPSKHGLLVFKHQERVTYSLGSFLLERFAHLVLAATQILEGLNEFLGNPPQKRFLLDPEWKFLRTMELDISRTVILMTFATLQLRLLNAGLHIPLPASPTPGSDTSRDATPVPSLVAPHAKGSDAPALKYPVPPSLTAALLGPVSFMLAIGVIPQHGGNPAVTAKPRLFQPGASISEVRIQLGAAAAAVQAAQASPSQFAAAAAVAAHALNAGGPPNQRWTSYNYQATPGQVGIPPPPFITGAPPNDPNKGRFQGNGTDPTGLNQPGGYSAPAPGGGDSNGGPGGWGGGGAPGGGGNSGGGAGGGGDGGPPTNPSANTPWPPPDWQLNHKLNLSMVPAWDGHGKTVINYLCSVAELTRLLPQMIVDLRAMAPLKFTDCAQTWWQTLSIDFRNSVSQNWNLLFNAILVHFLNEIWIHKRTAEWEEMHFHQKGYENKWLLDFIQRCVKHHMFLFPTSTDGPEVVSRILRNAPDVWLETINSTTHHDIFSLKAAVVAFGPTLMSNWNQAVRLGAFPDYTNRQHRRQGNAATVEEIEDENELLPKNSSPSKSAHVADSQTRGKFRSRETPTRPNWPEGKTVKGYAFVKRDNWESFRSRLPPLRKLAVLGDTNMIESDVDAIHEAEDLREWLAMMVEVNDDSDSAYSSELHELSELESRILRSAPTQQRSATAAHVLVNGAPNRNTCRRVQFETPKTSASASSKGNQLEGVTSHPPLIPQRVRQFKERRSPLAGSEGDRGSVPSDGNEDSTVPEEVTVEEESKYANPRFKDRRIVKAHQARSMPAGMSSLGVKVLHMKVHIGDPDAAPTIERLDSGADITLMSEEFFNSIPNLPRPREGL
ncbi:hypothetical protein K438DRAFT_1978319 [Mycena galopus ATCC 62051]|nr:hypothetical protein K438DRAFT_1978319 [Mycena galopus ATCC 62051]